MFEQYKDVITNFGDYSKNIFRKDYFKWLFGQMKNWSAFGWTLIGFNFIIQIILAWQGWNTVPPLHTIISFMAANLSVFCVVGIAQKSAIQGWFGATSAVFIALNAFLAHNYADMTLQIFYFIFLDAFCILSPSWNSTIKVHSIGGIVGWIKYIIFFFVTWGVAYLFYGMLNDPRLFMDSMTLAISITGSILEFNLAKEQTWFWITASVITLILWFQTAMAGDANWALFGSYSIFLLNDLWFIFSPRGWFRNQEVVKGFGKKETTVKKAK